MTEGGQNALQAMKKSNMVMEINTSGLRKPTAEIYPSETLLQVAYSMDIPITFSSDAHAVNQVGANYEQAIALAKATGYTKAVTFKGRDKQLVTF